MGEEVETLEDLPRPDSARPRDSERTRPPSDPGDVDTLADAGVPSRALTDFAENPDRRPDSTGDPCHDGEFRAGRAGRVAGCYRDHSLGTGRLPLMITTATRLG